MGHAPSSQTRALAAFAAEGDLVRIGPLALVDEFGLDLAHFLQPDGDDPEIIARYKVA